jgi:hypothetical protein
MEIIYGKRFIERRRREMLVTVVEKRTNLDFQPQRGEMIVIVAKQRFLNPGGVIY